MEGGKGSGSGAPGGPLALLFGLSARVDRGRYARWGFGLMLAKYALDALIVWLGFRVVWTPLDYLNPVLSLRDRALGGPSAPWFHLAMGLWSLPFLWIGVGMTMRRAHDAGLSVWTALLFFVPGVNYATMLVLCALPTAAGEPSAGPEPTAERIGRADALLGNSLAALGVSTAIALLGVLVLGERLESYGLTLFFLVPFLIGAVGAHLFNRPERQSLARTLGLVSLALLISCGLMLLLALEGALCIAMVAPLAWPVALLGAVFGRAAAGTAGRRAAPAAGLAPAALALIAVPALGALEAALTAPGAFAETSSIEIDAPPAQVWPRVVSFSELPAPTWLPFRLGIAYPVRAVIEGTGVGAVRRCEFSTGAFVEPITAWDEPRHLAFDVRRHPAPMHEWSPYRELAPPHLEGFFRSVRGEFRLRELAGGRTRLEGRTWYELRLFPTAYWRLWSDLLVHRIHGRVLEQIRREAEGARARAPGAGGT